MGPRTGCGCLAAVFVVIVAGCTGQIGGAGTAGDPSAASSPSPGNPANPGNPTNPGNPANPGNPVVDPSRPSACSPAAPKSSPVRRLNKREYANTVRHLFAMPALPVPALPSDATSGLGLDTSGSDLALSRSDVQTLTDATDQVVRDVGAAGAGQLTCAADVASDRAKCTQQILQRFLKRALRRPVPETELSLYTSLAAKGATQSEGTSLAVRAALLSPDFLFLVIDDSASQGGAHRLGEFELASRLSYGLWSSMPDDTLLSLAEKQQLSQSKVLAEQIERMLADPKSQGGVLGGAFARTWLAYDHLETADKDPKLFTGAAARYEALRAEMSSESDELFRHVVRENLPVDELLTADYSFMSNALASYYGLPAGAGGTGRRTVNTAQRRGILTHAAFLAATGGANTTDPIHRGALVAEHVACTKLFFPDNANLPPLSTDPKLSTRARLEKHRSDPGCAGCHSLFDPYGLALDSFDAIGRWREIDDVGFKVDPSGVMPGQGPGFRNAAELMPLMAEGPTFERCFATYLSSFTVGRTVGADEACAVEEVVARTQVPRPKIRDIVRDILMSDLVTKTAVAGR